MQPIQRLETMVITLPIEEGGHRNRWVPGIVYNPGQNRKNNRLTDKPRDRKIAAA
jgi:hypothetical protein